MHHRYCLVLPPGALSWTCLIFHVICTRHSYVQWNFYHRFKSWWRELVTACNLLLTISVLLFVFVSGETFYWVRLKNPIRNVWHINIYFLISVYCWVDCECKVWLFTDDWENYFVDFISFYDNYFYRIYTR